MTRPAATLAILLGFSVLSMWIDQRWAWSVVQCAALAALALWAVYRAWRPSAVRVSIWLIPLAAAPVWGLLQLLTGHTIYRWATWNAALNWTTFLALFLIALQIFGEPGARDWFLRFAVYFAFGLSILATIQLFTAGGRIFWLFPSGYRTGVMGPFVNPNQYAAFLEMILPIALWQAFRDRRRAWACFAMAAAMLASVVASASRAGLILMCAEAAAVFLLAWARGSARPRDFVRGWATFAAIAAALIAIVGWQTVRQRLWQPDPWAGRREFLISSIAMLRDRPLTGIGLGNWARAYPQYALFDDGTYVNQAHNDWMQWAVEGGAPFLVAIITLAAMAFRPALASLWGMGLLTLWLHCLVDYPMQQRPALAAWFFVLLGALAASRRSMPARTRPERLSPRPSAAWSHR